MKFLEISQISVVRWKWKAQISSPTEGKTGETQIPKLEAVYVELDNTGWPVNIAQHAQHFSQPPDRNKDGYNE